MKNEQSIIFRLDAIQTVKPIQKQFYSHLESEREHGEDELEAQRHEHLAERALNTISSSFLPG